MFFIRKFKRLCALALTFVTVIVSSTNVYAVTEDEIRELASSGDISGTLPIISTVDSSWRFSFDWYTTAIGSISIDELNSNNLLMWGRMNTSVVLDDSNEFFAMYLVDGDMILANVIDLVNKDNKTNISNITGIKGARKLSGINDFKAYISAYAFRDGGEIPVKDEEKIFGGKLLTADGEIVFDKDYIDSISFVRYENVARCINDISEDIASKVEAGKDVDEYDYLKLELLLCLIGGSTTDIDATKEKQLQFVSGIGKESAIVLYNDGANGDESISLSLIGYNGAVNENNLVVGDLSDLCQMLGVLYSKKPKLPGTVNVLKHLVEQVGGLSARISEEQGAQVDEDAGSAIVDDSKFEGLAAIDKWHNVLMNYYLTNEESKSGLDLNEFSEYPVKSDSESQWKENDSLALEEKLRLQAFATLRGLYNQSKTVHDGMRFPSSDVSNIGRINGAGINNSTGKSVEDIVDAVKKVVEDNETLNPVSNTSVKLVVENMDDIVRYLAAKLYGIKVDISESGEESGSEGLTTIKGSKYLESVIPQTNSKVPGVSVLPYNSIPGPMMNMKGVVTEVVNEFVGNSSIEAYYQLQHVVALAEYYAAFSAGIDVVGSASSPYELDDYSNLAIDELLANPDAVQNPKDAPKEGLVSYIKAYVEIARAIEYLGIDSNTLSLQMQKLLEYAGNLEPFYDSDDVKEYDSSNDKTEPMSAFFNLNSVQFHTDYLTGVELSATYVPLQTNLYDVNSVSMVSDSEWVMRFHYPFGFYRKVLYIDDDVNAAVNYDITKKKGNTRPATLKDLLQPEKDVVLYLDDNQYNINKIAEMQGLNYTRLANTENSSEDNSERSITERIGDWWDGVTNTDIESIAKTGPVKYYSTNVANKVSEYSKRDNEGIEFVLSSDAIDKYLKGYSTNEDEEVYSEYTPVQSFAVTSSVYRDKTLFNMMNRVSIKQPPVFVSSANLAAVNGASEEDWNSIYNYIMMKNLKSAMGVSYKTTLDVSSLLYMDIYGNIITESGLVVIPAMSNATLQKASKYTPYTIGFISLYNHGEFKIPTSYNNSEKYLESKFDKNEEDGVWELKQAKINDRYVEFEGLTASNENTLRTFMDFAKYNLTSQEALLFQEGVYRIVEVLRGAPIENIDKTFEGLTINGDVSKLGIYTAYKLEELSNALMASSNGNSLVALPNIAFIDGVEYIIFFLFKIMFLVLLVLLFIKVYRDTIEGMLGIKSVVSFVISCVMFIASAFAVPSLMDLSYYQSNKHLLQKEAMYLALLNLEKESEGREIGLTSVDSYDSATKLYLKVDDLTIPWYSIIDDVLLGSSINTISDAYEAEQENSIMANLPGMVKKGGGLYIDIDTMFDGTRVEYDPDTETLYTVTTKTPYVSFVTPYYYFLDQLVARVNKYNIDNEINNYTVKVMGHGAVKTVGMITPYFTSDYFWEQSQDITGLKSLYGVTTALEEESILDNDATSTDAVKASKWFKEDSDLELMEEVLDEVQEIAKEYVSDNNDLLGKVTDESFLKILALDLAIEYNRLAKVNAANAVELYDIDARDLIRMSIAERSNVMVDAPKSFARFVYDNAGTFGVITVALLVLVYFVASIVKPLCIFFIIGASVASIVIRRLLKKDKVSSIEGFVITLALLCGINFIYSLVLKFSMLLPNMSLTPQFACIVQVIIQCLYLVVLGVFTSFILRDWKDMGLARYERSLFNARYVTFRQGSTVNMSSPNVYYDREHSRGWKDRFKRGSRYDGDDRGSDILGSMLMNDRRRRENYGKKFKGNYKRFDES